MQLAEIIPTVLRLQSGRQIRGKLQVISVTGGLLHLLSPLVQGSRVRLMFMTEAGVVHATAEMLPLISSTQQPFRFLTIEETNERRLRKVIESSVAQKRRERAAIVKDRAW